MSDVNTGVPATPQPAVDTAPVTETPVSSEGSETDLEALEMELEEQEAASAPAEEKSKKPLTAAQKKKLKLKIDGQEEDFEVPESDDELAKYFQKAKAFDKRSNEYAQFKTQVDAMLEMLKNDPESFLEKAGFDVDDLAEKRLSRKVEEMKKSPEQLERERMQKELEDLKREKKAIEEAKQKAEAEKLRDQEATRIQNEIMEGIENAKTSLPKKNPKVYQKVAQALYFAVTNGYPQVTVKDVLPIVEKEWKEEMSSYFQDADDDLLEMMVGKANLDRYRKSQIAKKKSSVPAKPKIEDTGLRKPKEEKPAEKISYKNFFSNRPK